MNQEIFNREISLCRELSKKNGGKCKWGECEKCGVVPLLHKLFLGEHYDDVEEIRALKGATFE